MVPFIAQVHDVEMRVGAGRPGLFQFIHPVNEPEAKRWIFSLLGRLPQIDFIHVLVTLSVVWYAKRKTIHEKNQSLQATHHLSLQHLHDLESSKPKSRTRGDRVLHHR